MKKFRILFVAALILSVLAISVSAATLTLERTENEVSGGFDIAIKANVPENVQVLEMTLEFDNSKVVYVNNVNYVRHGEALCPNALDLEVIFDRECFPGERITLFQKDGFSLGSANYFSPIGTALDFYLHIGD